MYYCIIMIFIDAIQIKILLQAHAKNAKNLYSGIRPASFRLTRPSSLLFTHTALQCLQGHHRKVCFVALNIASTESCPCVPQCNGVKNLSSSEWQLTGREGEGDLTPRSPLYCHWIVSKGKKEREEKDKRAGGPYLWPSQFAWCNALKVHQKTANISII